MGLGHKARKPILIAMLIVIGLVGGAWWLTRPRLDQRFVGRWRVSDSTSIPGGGEVEFGGDGHAAWIDDLTTRQAFWRVDGDELAILFLGDGWRSRTMVQGLMLLSDPFTGYGLHYSVRHISPDQVVLSGPRESGRANAVITLQRVETSSR